MMCCSLIFPSSPRPPVPSSPRPLVPSSPRPPVPPSPRPPVPSSPRPPVPPSPLYIPQHRARIKRNDSISTALQIDETTPNRGKLVGQTSSFSQNSSAATDTSEWWLASNMGHSSNFSEYVTAVDIIVGNNQIKTTWATSQPSQSLT